MCHRQGVSEYRSELLEDLVFYKLNVLNDEQKIIEHKLQDFDRIKTHQYSLCDLIRYLWDERLLLSDRALHTNLLHIHAGI
jgi:hypothetical protein